jgi:hypothetical protein
MYSPVGASRITMAAAVTGVIDETLTAKLQPNSDRKGSREDRGCSAERRSALPTEPRLCRAARGRRRWWVPWWWWVPWRRIRVPRGWISRPRLSRGGFHNGWHSFAGAHTGVVGPDHWYHGWRNGRYGWWWGNGLGWTYYSYPWWGSDPDYGYYDYSQPYASQTWY